MRQKLHISKVFIMTFTEAFILVFILLGSSLKSYLKIQKALSVPLVKLQKNPSIYFLSDVSFSIHFIFVSVFF